MTIEEINKLEVSERIKELKKRPFQVPNKEQLLSDWEPNTQ